MHIQNELVLCLAVCGFWDARACMICELDDKTSFAWIRGKKRGRLFEFKWIFRVLHNDPTIEKKIFKNSAFTTRWGTFEYFLPALGLSTCCVNVSYVHKSQIQTKLKKMGKNWKKKSHINFGRFSTLDSQFRSCSPRTQNSFWAEKLREEKLWAEFLFGS